MSASPQSTRVLLLLSFFFFHLGLEPVPAAPDPDPQQELRARQRLESVLGNESYLVFTVDTLLEQGALPGRTDVIFLGCNGAINCSVEGNVIVVDGELGLRSGAVVEGDLVTVRSKVFKSGRASVKGELLKASPGENLRLFDNRLQIGLEKRGTPFRLGLEINRMGGFAVDGYDRIDGFSCSWGFNLVRPEWPSLPFLKTRLVSATTHQAIGVDALVQFPLDHHQRYVLAVQGGSKTDTNDRWRLGDLENAVKAFIVGYDHRYYFRREGYSVSLRRRLGRRSQLKLSYRDERCYSLNNLSPFTMFGLENFHPNLPVDPGRIRSLLAEGVLDTRNDPFFTLTGFLVQVESELAGGALGGRWGFSRVDLSLQRWDTFAAKHHTFLWLKGAFADKPLPFQRSYTLGNTLRAFDNFAFSGDRMLLGQASYGLDLPKISVVEYLFFHWRAELVYETGIAFSSGDPDLGYGSLEQDLGLGISGDTILGRLSVHLFKDLKRFSDHSHKIAVSLNLNVSR